MYAENFTVTIKSFDGDYLRNAQQVRDLALRNHVLSNSGCINFVRTTEGDREIAISYWPSLTAIKWWKQYPQHMKARERGKNDWHLDYRGKSQRNQQI